MVGVILMSFVIAGLACVEGKRMEPDSEYHDAVIVKVGEAEITLADLLAKPQVYPILNDGLIAREVARQEAAKRGITPDMEFIQEQINVMIGQNGGYDAFMEQMGQQMPVILIPNDVREYFIHASLQQSIIDDLWEEQQMPRPEEELMELWETNGERYRLAVSSKLGLDIADVTYEMAVDEIIAELKTNWLSVNSQTSWQEIMDSYEIENYLLDSWAERDFVVVPLADEDLGAGYGMDSSDGGVGGEEGDVELDEHGHAAGSH